ncbi:MAG TPA: DUF998 domain-containing protein [Longimicrobiales bacterium]|nr:DUF998 domain-containing protein [Longimicrobiales bacterium]
MDTTTTPDIGSSARLTQRAARAAGGARLRTALLACAIVAFVYYVGVNVYVPARWPGYSVLSRVVSELSAIDAPTRTLWVRLLIPYTILMVAFGWGVYIAAGERRALRAAGVLLIANAVLGAFWPPMHLRGAERTLTDTLHIVWSFVWLVVMLLVMGLAASALARRFRVYTLATLAIFVVFGALTSLDGAKLAADLPTPWIGLWERINMGAGMLWTAVLAGALLWRPASR